MTSFLAIIFFIIVTSFVGYNIILLFDKKHTFSFLERLGLSYLFGIAAISMEMFILGLFKIRFVTLYILLPWVVIFILNVIQYRKNRMAIETFSSFAFKFGGFEKLLISLLSFEIIYTFFRALMKPIESYDSVAIWSLKAKILYLANTVPANFFNMITNSFEGIHPDYPLLVPFSEVWFYTFFNNFNDYLVKIIFPFNFLAFLPIFYFVLKRITENRKMSLLFTFILASIKQFSDYAIIGAADLQMAIYCSLTFMFLFLWVKYNNTSYLITSIISCIFTFWTKNEGLFVLLIVSILLTYLLFIKKKSLIFAICILFVLFVTWSVFKINLGLENDIINIATFKKLNLGTIFRRPIPIAYEYQKHLFGLKKWNFVWIAFLYILFVNGKKLSFKEYGYIGAPALVILLAYTIVYMITPRDILWHLGTTASRLLIHILPLVVLFIALNVNNKQIFN